MAPQIGGSGAGGSVGASYSNVGGGGGSSGFSGMETVGLGLAAGGAAAGVVNAFYSVKAMSYQAAMQASALRFQQSAAFRRANMAELAAREMAVAGQEEAGQVSLQFGQLIETTKAKGSASGTQAGVGSRAEIAASQEMAKDISIDTVTKSSANRVAAMRMQSGAARSQATLLGGRAAQADINRDLFGRGTQNAAALLAAAGGAANFTQTYARTQSNYSTQGQR